MQRSSARFSVVFSVPATVLLPLVLAGCHKAIRDQAQVDPVVQSHVQFSGVGFGQPLPLIPNCSVQQWIDRAAGHETDRHCPLSRSPGQTVELNAYPGNLRDDKVRRTQVQAELMTYADQVCDGHVAGIYSKHATTNLNFGFLSLLFSGGAAVAAGRTATNLAAGSALFSGTRSLVNSDVYYSYIGPAVMREIRAMRGDLRKQITEKRSCDVNDYPPQEAINDALIYHDACSFSTGLASLLSKAGDTKVGEDKLRVAQLKTMVARLTTKKEELKAAETEFGALLAADAQGAKGKMLGDRIERLTGEVERLDSVLTFSGVVDPEPDPAAPANLSGALSQAEADYEIKEKIAKTATGTEKDAADKAVKAADNFRKTLQAQREALLVAEKNVAIAEKAVDDAHAKIRVLKEALAQLELKKGGQAEANQKKAELETARPQLKAAEKNLDEAKMLFRKMADDASAPSNIEFGIQRCAPLTPPTVRQ